MSDARQPDPGGRPPADIEIPLEPSVAGRIARWTTRARVLQARVEALRADHASVDIGFAMIERDSSIGGGLLAGALAYRLFVLLLPTALLLVSGLGLYAGAVDESPGRVARDAGLHGLIASQVAATATSGTRWLIFLAMIPVLAYALVKTYRAVAIVHSIIWEGTGRGVRLRPRALGLMAAGLVLNLVAAWITGWFRRRNEYAGLGSVAAYLILVGGAWLVITRELPHRDARWTALLPGAAVFGVGLLGVNVFNLYVTTRAVEGNANTYGALGIAAAILFSLVLVGRLMVLSAELNELLYTRRTE
jgi:hypothetical protein